jgi:hypothetical protein
MHKSLREGGQRWVEPVTVEMQSIPGSWEGVPREMPESEGLAALAQRKPAPVQQEPQFLHRIRKRVVRRRYGSATNREETK